MARSRKTRRRSRSSRNIWSYGSQALGIIPSIGKEVLSVPSAVMKAFGKRKSSRRSRRSSRRLNVHAKPFVPKARRFNVHAKSFRPRTARR